MLSERFRSKVNTSGPIPAHRPGLGRCHVWTACIGSGGYGLVRVHGKVHKAHRVAFLLAHGRWPEPYALHRCDTPSCVNPYHLFEGDDIANMADRDAKGRQRAKRGDQHYARLQPQRLARGSRHGNAKLTEQAVREIKLKLDSSLGRNQRQLAREYGISQAVISKIWLGKGWVHVQCSP